MRKNEWWIVIDAEGRSFGAFMGETLAEVSAKNWTEVFPTDGFRVLRVVPADEVEALRAALVRVQNFPSHPGAHPADQSADADDPASWRDGWACAVYALQERAMPYAE